MKQQFKKEFDEAWTPMNEKPFWRVSIPIAILAAIFAYVLGSTSCNPAKEIAKAKNVLSQNPKESAKYCAEKHPVKESVKIDTVYKQGKIVVKHHTDYVTVDCDSVLRASIGKSDGRSKIVRVPVPTYLQVDTQAIQTEITQESIAAQIVLTNKIDSLKDIVKAKDSIITSKDVRIGTIKTQRNFGLYGCGLLLLAAFIFIVGLVKGWFR